MLKIGIVGLPNVGKSTLFNILTQSKSAEAANYPFCTIEPNVGIVEVPDKRLAALSSVVHPERVVPAAIQFVDIAGLVRGAAQGEGLGNKFLSHVRECDALVQVVRVFENADVHHVHGKVHPADDIEVIQTELILADIESLEKQEQNWIKKAKGKDAEAQKAVQACQKLLEALKQGTMARCVILDEEEQQVARHFHLLTMKPMLYAANVSEDQFVSFVSDFGAVAAGAVIVPVCVKLEEDLIGMDEAEAQEYRQTFGLDEKGVDRLIREGYRLLGLQTYFTAGVKEVRAWTIHIGDTAPQAAGVIHTDFEKKFIRAEVMFWEDFVSCQGEKGAREKGLLRVEGKDYIVADGDVLNFLHGA